MHVLLGYTCLQDGETALHATAKFGYLACMKELLARGAAVDHADKVRGTLPCSCCLPCGLTQRQGQKRAWCFRVICGLKIYNE